MDVSNLHRQVLHTSARVGMSKAESAKIGIKRLVDYGRIYMQQLSRYQSQSAYSSQNAANTPDTSERSYRRQRAGLFCLLAGSRLHRQCDNALLFVRRMRKSGRHSREWWCNRHGGLVRRVELAFAYVRRAGDVGISSRPMSAMRVSAVQARQLG